MTQLIRKAALGLALAATATMASAPVQAQSYDRYDRHRGGDAGAAIAAGIVGLAIGAALSSGSHGRYYNDGYYNSRYRGDYDYPQQTYYNYNNYPRGYNYDNYQRGYDYNYDDRRYRDADRYERKHRKWHRNHGDWDD